MDLTFQVPMQYCSLQHRILLLSPVTSTTGYCFCFGSRRLRLRFGAAHHGLAPEAKAGPLGRRAWGRREAAERTTGALGAGRRLWGRGHEAGAVCRLLAQLAARVAAQSRRLAGCPPPPPPWAPEGALRAESHLGAEAPGTPSRTGSWAPPPPSRFARLER